MTIEQAYRTAVEHHRAGRLAQAEGLYRQVLQVVPDHPDAMHMLGAIALAVGQPLPAIELISKAIARRPDLRGAYNNLGEAQRIAGQLDAAVTSFQKAIDRAPSDSAAYNNLGLAQSALGRRDEALATFERAIASGTPSAGCISNYATLLDQCGWRDEAIAMHRRAIQVGQNYPVAFNNYAVALNDRGQLGEAEAMYRRAVEIDSNFADAWSNLGNLMRRVGRYDDAIAALERGLAANPSHPAATLNLGLTQFSLGRYGLAADFLECARNLEPKSEMIHPALALTYTRLARHADAERVYQEGLAIHPTNANLLAGLAMLIGERGEVSNAIDLLRRAVEIAPTDKVANDTLLLYLNYVDLPPREVYEAHVRWGQTCLQDAINVGRTRSFASHERTPDRKLRIGYASADYRVHSVLFFVRPILVHHDRSAVEVFCYDNTLNPDVVSASLRDLDITWRRVVGWTDAQIAQQILDDRIDILVDLGGHTAENLLGAFALKPAPVLVTYQGYPNTTGLPTMDYRLTDAIADPPGVADSLHTENLVRLPRTNWCFAPLADYPEASALPAAGNGFITFGSFNNFAKVSPRTVALWSRTLDAIPKSKLLLKANGLSDPATKSRVIDMFASHGVSGDRLILAERTATLQAHLDTYHRVDIALDTTPYHGTTTTCEAMWMGVPVITLMGDVHASRVGGSLLRSVRLSHLATDSEDGFLEAAKSLAGDLSALAALRSSLRARMAESPLCDAPSICRDLEASYRAMWQYFTSPWSPTG